MDNPFIGKQADIFNKKAMILLSKGQEDLAVKQWEEAFKMKEKHMDSIINYTLYKWRHA